MGDQWKVVRDFTALRPHPETWVVMSGSLSTGMRVIGDFRNEADAREVAAALNAAPRVAQTAQVLTDYALATDRDLLQRAKEALVYAHRWMEHGCVGEPCEVRDTLSAIEARLKETA